MGEEIRREVPPSRGSGSLEEEAVRGIHRTADALSREVADLLRTRDLTPVQYNLLRILRGAGAAGISAGEIGERLLTRTPDVTRLVDRLERQGRARRARAAEDRRVVRVLITEAGLRVLAELDRPMSALHRRQLGHLGPQRLAALVDLLHAARHRD